MNIKVKRYFLVTFTGMRIVDKNIANGMASIYADKFLNQIETQKLLMETYKLSSVAIINVKELNQYDYNEWIRE